MRQSSGAPAITTVHVRFQGRSEELTLASLHLDPTATETEVKQAVAASFEVPAVALADYVVVRTSTAIIVRPEAIYG